MRERPLRSLRPPVLYEREGLETLNCVFEGLKTCTGQPLTGQLLTGQPLTGQPLTGCVRTSGSLISEI